MTQGRKTKTKKKKVELNYIHQFFWSAAPPPSSLSSLSLEATTTVLHLFQSKLASL